MSEINAVISNENITYSYTAFSKVTGPTAEEFYKFVKDISVEIEDGGFNTDGTKWPSTVQAALSVNDIHDASYNNQNYMYAVFHCEDFMFETDGGNIVTKEVYLVRLLEKDENNPVDRFINCYNDSVDGGSFAKSIRLFVERNGDKTLVACGESQPPVAVSLFLDDPKPMPNHFVNVSPVTDINKILYLLECSIHSTEPGTTAVYPDYKASMAKIAHGADYTAVDPNQYPSIAESLKYILDNYSITLTPKN